METVRAPPLPPKMRRAPPASTTVLTTSAAPDVFSSKFDQSNGDLSNISSSSVGSHVVKIRINPHQESDSIIKNNSGVKNGGVICELSPCIRISVNSEHEDMIQHNQMVDTAQERSPGAYFFYGPYNCGVMSSGQVSPSDTLDSGTCSDLDSTPPPLPKKKSSSTGGSVTVTVIGNHKRDHSLTSSGADVDSDDNESSISCDSLNSGDLNGDNPVETSILHKNKINGSVKINTNGFLPQGLLKDIRDRNVKLTKIKIKNEEPHIIQEDIIKNDEENCTQNVSEEIESPFDDLPSPNKYLEQQQEEAETSFDNFEPRKSLVDESTYELRKQKEKELQDEEALSQIPFDPDMYYDFHMNEHAVDTDISVVPAHNSQDESFAGYKDLLNGDGSSTIRSAKGTVRGVKNRVRAGIATFLQINSIAKSYKEKDAGKVVVYTTTMGIVRETYQACMKVKQIMRTLLIKFEERDVFMSCEYQGEIRDRMRCDHILVPQVFVDGQHVGDAETVERLNETGELRRILKPYKSMDACTTCKVCGGYRLLPCPICNGSKKSVHRNHFTAEFVALKCMNCDEVGLVKCTSC